MTEQQYWLARILMRSAGTCNWPTDHALMQIHERMESGELSLAQVRTVGGEFLIGELARVIKDEKESEHRSGVESS